MTKYIPAVAAALLIASCTPKGADTSFTVTAPVDSTQTGLKAYIIDYDNGARLDSVLVGTDSVITFTGTVDKPILARLIVGTQRCGTFVLEPGQISIAPDRTPSGTPLNTELARYSVQCDSLETAYREAANDSVRQSVLDFSRRLDSEIISSRSATPLGYLVFVNAAYDFTPEQFDSLLAAHPAYGEYERVQKLIASNRALKATASGTRFVDFGNGTDSLSAYAGRGRYTLVDFWASWCGPCRREMPVVKELLEEYGSKGLDVVGVAVWDDVADSERAVEQLQLPWPQIMGTGTSATDIYGISGIPHIMLIAPDGTIMARGMQGDSLRAVVRRAFEPEVTASAPSSPDATGEY